MSWRVIPRNTTNKTGELLLDLQGRRLDLLALPVDMQKDITGLSYKFGIVDSQWLLFFEKDLDVIDIPTGKLQLTLTKNNTTNDRANIPVNQNNACYTYSIIECIDVTGGDATTLFWGEMNVLKEIPIC